MIKFIHLNYHFHKEFKQPAEVLQKHKLASGFVTFLDKLVDLLSIKHLNYEGQHVVEGISYAFFRSANKFWYIPRKTHLLIRKEYPEIILIEGFIFPIQVIHLRWMVGKRPVIIVQHHGEKPFKGVKRLFQKLADRCINAYIFTSVGNAGEWMHKGVIATAGKCYEVLSASTDFIAVNKHEAKCRLGLDGEFNFLWVGRLNSNKDPLTILQAFNKYLEKNEMARLYMIYQAEDILMDIKAELVLNPLLKNRVILLGKIEHNKLSDWYNGADFYISGSHNEGSGYALVEAMACGCIPVVTNIPSFTKITAQGKYGILYNPGDPADLLNKLLLVDTIDREKLIPEIIVYSKSGLSFQAIADQIYRLSSLLTAK